MPMIIKLKLKHEVGMTDGPGPLWELQSRSSIGGPHEKEPKNSVNSK